MCKYMTIFDISKAGLRYIFDVTRTALGNAGSREAHRYVRFTCKAGELTAAAVDGYRIHSVTIPVNIINGRDSFSFLLKPFALPATDSDYIQCTLDKKEITFDFGNRKYIERLGEDIEGFMDVEKAMPNKEPVERIGFNPKYLVDALKSFKQGSRNPVVLEIRDSISPIVIRSKQNPTDYRLVLPVRMKGQ